MPKCWCFRVHYDLCCCGFRLLLVLLLTSNSKTCVMFIYPSMLASTPLHRLPAYSIHDSHKKEAVWSLCVVCEGDRDQNGDLIGLLGALCTITEQFCIFLGCIISIRAKALGILSESTPCSFLLNTLVCPALRLQSGPFCQKSYKSDVCIYCQNQDPQSCPIWTIYDSKHCKDTNIGYIPTFEYRIPVNRH